MSLNANRLIKFENESDLHNISRIIECLNRQHLMWYIENTHMCAKLAECITTDLLNPYPKSPDWVYVIYSKNSYEILKNIVELDYMKKKLKSR